MNMEAKARELITECGLVGVLCEKCLVKTLSVVFNAGMEKSPEYITTLETALRELMDVSSESVEVDSWPALLVAINKGHRALAQTEDTGEQDAADVLGDVPGFNIPRQTEETPDDPCICESGYDPECPAGMHNHKPGV